MARTARWKDRALAVARLTPTSQQIDFHGLRLARNQTIRASSASSQRSQRSASSASVISRGLGRGRRIRASWPTWSPKLWKYSDLALKYPCGFTSGSRANTSAASSSRSTTCFVVQSATAHLPNRGKFAIEFFAELTEQFPLRPGQPDLFILRGPPEFIRSDNEFIAKRFRRGGVRASGVSRGGVSQSNLRLTAPAPTAVPGLRIQFTMRAVRGLFGDSRHPIRRACVET